ncbi:unnamed protein product [Symbiodinium natans]|uniref:Apple domain-containing protein n=1 Tax=Symbiodinium natans TaxID=878477 RepID=A0A812T7R7_9DINO|nr:unnamed protein product [Symbiodinium natans]
MIRGACILLAFRGVAADADIMPSCAVKGMAYSLDRADLLNVAYLSDSKQCQVSCQTMLGCTHFTWKEDSYPGGACYLYKGKLGKETTDEKAISGPKACPDDEEAGAPEKSRLLEFVEEDRGWVEPTLLPDLVTLPPDTKNIEKAAHQLLGSAADQISELAGENGETVAKFQQSANQLLGSAADQISKLAGESGEASEKFDKSTHELLGSAADEIDMLAEGKELGAAPGAAGGDGGNSAVYGVIGGIAGCLAVAGGAHYFMSGKTNKTKKIKRAATIEKAPLVEEAPEQPVPSTAAPAVTPGFQQYQGSMYPMAQPSQMMPVPQYYQVPNYQPMAYYYPYPAA